MAIGGALLLLSSLVIFHLSDSSGFSFALYALFLIAFLGIVLRLAIWRVRSSSSICLKTDQEGYCASTYPKELIGKTGYAANDLHPSGHIVVEEQTFQALADQGYIEKGSLILITGGQGSHLIVHAKVK